MLHLCLFLLKSTYNIIKKTGIKSIEKLSIVSNAYGIGMRSVV